MKKGTVETTVGVFVLIGLLCVGYLTIKLGRMEWFGERYYQVEAFFNSVSGLKSGAQVEMAGVTVGRVDEITLDQESRMARVKLKIREEVVLYDDVIASIRTTGLIGDKFIMLSPGGAGLPIEPGGAIFDTESALDIEELISRYVFGDLR
jgi:phospholipid/cholesterol/gamma-HCH transport system substrate-binding protein